MRAEILMMDSYTKTWLTKFDPTCMRTHGWSKRRRTDYLEKGGERIYYHYGQADQVLSELDENGEQLFD